MQSYDWTEGLKKLSWEQMVKWAGEKKAGKARKIMSLLRDVMTVENRGAVAIVLTQGEPHGVSIVMAPTGDILTMCTCSPRGVPCEHAVALLWTCREAALEGRSLPQLDIQGLDMDKLLFSSPDDYEDEDEWDDEAEDDVPGVYHELEKFEPPASFANSLKKMKKQEIIDLVVKVASLDEDIYEDFVDHMNLASGNPARIEKALDRELDKLMYLLEDLWEPDDVAQELVSLREMMEKLVESGQADAVVDLGMQLWERVPEIVYFEDDNQRDYFRLLTADCMEVAVKACLLSSMPSGEKLVWIINRYLEDALCLLDEEEYVLEKGDFTRKDWGYAANALKEMLKALISKNEKGFVREHKEAMLLEWLEISGYKAGKGIFEKALEYIAQATGNYSHLIAFHKSTGNSEKAVNCIVAGLKKLMKTPNPAAWSLFNSLAAIAEEQGDELQALALVVEKFYFRPALDGYEFIRGMAEELNVWPSVQKGLLEYLDTGKRPQSLYEENKDGGLPQPWFVLPKNKNWKAGFPYYSLLINTAVQENRIDDAIREYRRCQKEKKGGCAEIGASLAESLKKSHPELAIEIIQGQITEYIEQKSSQAYQKAGEFLLMLKKTYGDLGRKKEWLAYHQQLIKEYRSRHKMVRVLRKLER